MLSAEVWCIHAHTGNVVSPFKKFWGPQKMEVLSPGPLPPPSGPAPKTERRIGLQDFGKVGMGVGVRGGSGFWGILDHFLNFRINIHTLSFEVLCDIYKYYRSSVNVGPTCDTEMIEFNSRLD